MKHYIPNFWALIYILSFTLSHFINVVTSDGSSDYGFETSDGSYRIYDLTNDPYENTDVSEDDGYASYVSTFEERRSYWQALTVDTNEPDETSKMKSWNSCGRVCPWISDTTTITIEQKYTTTDAPHIVFVLIDDWGYNDMGASSTYLGWTTPTIDKLANEGILLDSYYTNEVCAPSRASLMTGRYVLRTGVYTNNAELPLTEITLAQELKSAGYRNYIVGKWHLGMSTYSHMPTYRGFDYFYGYVNGKNGYWTKTMGEYIDLFENDDFVTASDELDSSLHSAYLFQSKVEEIIEYHATNYADTPMFLYYPMQLVHSPLTAPVEYLKRCTIDVSDAYASSDDATNGDYSIQNYCAMMVMMDEAIANLTCSLNSFGLGDNTILIISGDNGGESSISGNSYPFKGHKGSILRGGISNHAIVHSNLIPESSRGTTYSENVHITDWLPTLMGKATNGQWTGSYGGVDIDGFDIWDNMLAGTSTGRVEMVFSSYGDSFASQIHNIKYIYNFDDAKGDSPTMTFESDLDSSISRMECESTSLIQSETNSKQDYFSSMLSFVSLSPSTSKSIATSFVLFLFMISITVVAFALMASFRNKRIEESQDPTDLYAMYKHSDEVESETRALL